MKLSTTTTATEPLSKTPPNILIITIIIDVAVLKSIQLHIVDDHSKFPIQKSMEFAIRM